MSQMHDRGDYVMARENRRTLDELCWSPSGYPAPVIAALRNAGYTVDASGQLA